MKRLSIFSICVILFFMFSCKKQVTCAAYQSYFLLDDEAQTHFFNPFGEDSLPKTSQIVNKKAGNGITAGIDPKTYKKYHYFVPMEDVISMPDDTITFEEDAIMQSDEDGVSTSATKSSDANDDLPVGGEGITNDNISDEIIPDDNEIIEDDDEFDPDEFIEDDEGDFDPDEYIEDDED